MQEKEPQWGSERNLAFAVIEEVFSVFEFRKLLVRKYLVNEFADSSGTLRADIVAVREFAFFEITSDNFADIERDVCSGAETSEVLFAVEAGELVELLATVETSTLEAIEPLGINALVYAELIVASDITLNRTTVAVSIGALFERFDALAEEFERFDVAHVLRLSFGICFVDYLFDLSHEVIVPVIHYVLHEEVVSSSGRAFALFRDGRVFVLLFNFGVGCNFCLVCLLCELSSELFDFFVLADVAGNDRVVALHAKQADVFAEMVAQSL